MIEINEGSGRHEVMCGCIITQGGLIAHLLGGEKPHVGGVVLSLPRQSLTGGGIGCDSWVLPLPGHKDVIVGRMFAETLCKSLNLPVSLTAGIHIGNATDDDIAEISRNCDALAARLLEVIRETGIQGRFDKD
ncbi:MAG: hypothetical protein LBB28_02450 [Synergistaceae bacterium]|jgi:hypothetical protein|nr:hypothetical protein [Synergistaceae bacterium]